MYFYYLYREHTNIKEKFQFGIDNRPHREESHFYIIIYIYNNFIGVSSDLLERIRHKEQKKLELAMRRNPKQELRISRMERLPDMSRIIKSYFVTERKAAITLQDCVQKLSESYGTDLHISKINSIS